VVERALLCIRWWKEHLHALCALGGEKSIVFFLTHHHIHIDQDPNSSVHLYWVFIPDSMVRPTDYYSMYIHLIVIFSNGIQVQSP